MTAPPLAMYGSALRRAAAGQPGRLRLVRADGGSEWWLDAAAWSGGLRPGDRSVLRRCRGAILDVGCGPGRMAAELVRCGQHTLGLDISAEAVRLTRRRGAPAVRGSVFDPLPGEGHWGGVLLVDGNIGIGGDPERLLRRCRAVLRPDGSVFAEVQPPGAPGWRTEVVLHDAERVSARFPWAAVAASEVGDLAGRAGLRLCRLWTEAGRWFSHLAPP